MVYMCGPVPMCQAKYVNISWNARHNPPRKVILLSPIYGSRKPKLNKV